MNSDLPAVLDDYFRAQNAHNIDAMVACFAEDARVHDEQRDHGGRDAIRAWVKETSEKYRVTVEPLELREQDGLAIVVARVSGTFPGSPANLAFSFSLSGGHISSLEIH